MREKGKYVWWLLLVAVVWVTEISSLVSSPSSCASPMMRRRRRKINFVTRKTDKTAYNIHPYGFLVEQKES
jgi:hypothetical protein